MKSITSNRLKVLWLVLPLLLFIPPIVSLFIQKENRHLEGVRLNEVQYREVFFRNEEQNLKLAGLLFVPEGEGPKILKLK